MRDHGVDSLKKNRKKKWKTVCVKEMGQDKHRQTGAIGMATLNSLSELPTAIVEPIGFVGFDPPRVSVSLVAAAAAVPA